MLLAVRHEFREHSGSAVQEKHRERKLVGRLNEHVPPHFLRHERCVALEGAAGEEPGSRELGAEREGSPKQALNGVNFYIGNGKKKNEDVRVLTGSEHTLCP